MGGRRLVVEADGGSRGNPGNAGYGALVRDGVSGAVVAERAESVGIASNNVAEYSGLVAGLKAAFDIDPAAQVQVRLDSKLLVEQMSGRWKIKHEDMRRLALEAREVAADLRAAGGSVTYTWIPRAENSAADRAIVHINSVDCPRTYERDVTPGPTGALHHVALRCTGHDELLARLRQRGLDYQLNEVPAVRLRQVFALDPNGVLLELNFFAQ